MSDESTRRICIAQQAEAAARKQLDTGEPQPNPHRGTENESVFQAAFDRFLHLLSTGESSA